MAETNDLSAWITLFFGLYSFAASIGEWRTPGMWATMLEDFEGQRRRIEGVDMLCTERDAALKNWIRTN